MSFFGKFKGVGGSSGQTSTASPTKKDAHAAQPTLLERHLRDLPGPIRPDGSDKFFGFENYGSTCYCNSIIQCLYYSAPFRDHVMNFPPKQYLDSIPHTESNGSPLLPRSTSQIPYPNPTSPARKDYVPPVSPGNPNPKQEESKDSPEYKKRTAIKTGPVLDMIHDRSNNYGMEESLFTALKDIFDAIKGNPSRYGIVSPHKFLEILRRENEMFRSAMHQDAHEFWNLLLNQVVDSVELFSKQHPELSAAPVANGGLTEKTVATNAPTPKTPGNGLDVRWVHDLFEGLLTSETRCLTCENTSHRDEPFLDLSVDLSTHTSVTSCLRKFSEEEMLCERNKFHCDNCGGLQEAEKRMKIKRLPRVLALHLKRFKYTEDLQRLQKLFHRVVYPFHLRLFNTTDDAEDSDRLYELYAVVVHIGGGPYHGHYVTIVKTQDRGWLLFDDELVEPVDKAYVQSFFGGEPVPGVQDARQLACAYVLFYQETTLEAMLREQELENQQPATTAAAAAAMSTGRVSDVDASVGAAVAKDPFLSPTFPHTNGLHHVTTTNTIGTTEPLDHAETSNPLAHIRTAPVLSDQSLTSPRLSTDPETPAKTRKELKAESKSRKAAAKAEEKALQEKRREASSRRIETWRKAQEEMTAAIEASKLTAADEAKTRGEPIANPATFGEGKKGVKVRLKENSRNAGVAANSSGNGANANGHALGLFARHGSLSLRGKPRWMGGSGGGGGKLETQNEDTQATDMTAAAAATATVGTVDGTQENAEEKVAELPSASFSTPLSPTNTSASATAEDRSHVKRNRFSLGRKRSQAMT